VTPRPRRHPAPADATLDGVALKEQLLANRIGEAHPVDLAIGTVHVRALSRGEVFGAQQITDVQKFEAKLVSLGLVEPTMTADEVATWQANSPAGEIEQVVEKIKELSGLADESAKEAYKSL
jgi:hypothetical protein